MRTNCPAAFRAALAAFAFGCLTGCFDTKQEITLNPDGSGKAVIESSFVSADTVFDNGRSPGGGASNFVRKLIEDAQGVEAWRDVSFRDTAEGRTWFRGTAYFSDLSKLKVSVAPFLRFAATTNPVGQLTLTTVADTPPAIPGSTSKGDAPATVESIERERRQFRAAQPVLAAMVGTMKQDTVFRVPGAVRQASNFETVAPQALRIRWDGARLMAVMEELVFSEEVARKRLAGIASSNLFGTDNFVSEKLFGQRAPVFAVIQPGRKPLFDYAAEVAAARKTFPEIATALGLDQRPFEAAKPAVDGTPARVRVTGIQWNFDGKGAHGHGGYTLSLAAELPGTVLSVDKVSVDRAVTLEGASLLLPHRFGYGVSRSGVAKLLTNVNFTIQLGAPPVDSKGIAELSGFPECRAAGSVRAMSLVPGPLRDGSRGTEFGAQLDELRTHVSGGDRIVLRARLAPEQLWSLKAVDDAGQTVRLEKHGMMAIGEERVYTFVSTRPIPRAGRLVAEVMTEPAAGAPLLRIPFSVTNVTLMGQPLAAR